MKFSKTLLFACLALLLCASHVAAAEIAVRGAFYEGPAVMPQQAKSRPQVLRVDLELLNASAVVLSSLPNQKQLLQKKPGAKHIGINRTIERLADAKETSGLFVWSDTPDGGMAAGLQIISPGAAGVRLGFVFRDLPPAAELRFFEKSGDQPPSSEIMASGAKILDLIKLNRLAEPDNPDADVYWSPTVAGDSAIVEVYLPPGVVPADLSFTVPVISHLVEPPFSDYGHLSGLEYYGASNPCQIDATCYSDWANIRSAVAKMIYTTSNGTYICTGTMLNDNDPATWIPYFISANHCIATQTAASSLQTLWHYRSDSCNSSGLSSDYRRLDGGATLLWTGGMAASQADSSKDTSLLLLNDAPPAGVYFAGWNANAATDGAKTGLHHPAGDYAKISFGSTDGARYACWTVSGGYFQCAASATGSFFKVTWQNGGTEGGSSGSGIYHDNDQLIGDLTGGGGGDCTGSYSYYSSFGAAFNDGNLGQWLNKVDVPARIAIPGPTSLLLDEDDS